MAKNTPSWRAGCKVKALTLPRETRQNCLDMIHSGITIGGTAFRCGISDDAVVGVINLNLKTITILNKVTV